MSISPTMSPALQAMLNNPVQHQAATSTPVANAEPAQVVEAKKGTSFKGNKKLLIGAAAAAGVAAIVIGTILISKGKTQKAIAETEKVANELAQSVLESASGIRTKGQGIIDDVLSVFKKGEETDYADILDEAGKVVVKKFEKEGDIVKLFEYASDGTTLTRNAVKNSIDDVLTIEDFAQKLEVTSQNGILDSFREGVEHLTDGGKKILKEFFFNDDKLIGYTEGVELMAEGGQKTAKWLSLQNEKIWQHAEGIEDFADGRKKVARSLAFEDGKPYEYEEGIKVSAEGDIKQAKHLIQEDGAWKKPKETKGFGSYYTDGECCLDDLDDLDDLGD